MLPNSGERDAAGHPAGDTDRDWWRQAVVYQIYPRSFADANGDGVGDIAGIRSRLGYLARLGVDAIWISPWYPSPMKDAGYDVSDYHDIDPVFGDLGEAEALVREAHAHGLRVIIDLVPNHTSDQHPWFQAALRAGPGSPERDRYIFRDGRGADGQERPNNWRSVFGGPAWTRVPGKDGQPEQWYLHLFAPEQPDLDWNDAAVRADFEATIRFWFDRGVDGFRIDVAHGLAKADGLPDIDDAAVLVAGDDHPHWDRDEAQDVFRSWRAIADSYTPPRVFVAEAWVNEPARLARYVRPDVLHTAFNFDYLLTPWHPVPLRQTIAETLQAHATVGAPPTWVLSNHDVPREVSRFGRVQRDRLVRRLPEVDSQPADLATGLRRSRAAALLMLALPGSAYIYQGQELGLPEVEDLPFGVKQDPVVRQSGGERHGRDGCRVPMPWAGSVPPYGFSPPGAVRPPWLPQPESWACVTVAAQEDRAGSVLELFRTALALRRDRLLGVDEFSWWEVPEGALAFGRGSEFACVVNLLAAPIALPAPWRVMVASGALTPNGYLPPDTAVWLGRG